MRYASLSMLPLLLLATLPIQSSGQSVAPFRLIDAYSGMCIRYRTSPQINTGVTNWLSTYPCSNEGTDPNEYWFFSCVGCANLQSVVTGGYLQCGSGLSTDVGSETAGYCYVVNGYTGACQQNFYFKSSANTVSIVNSCYGGCVDEYDTSTNYMVYLYTCEPGNGHQMFTVHYFTCPAGTYISIPNQNSLCTACPANYYCPGNNVASPCSTGRVLNCRLK